MVQARFDIERVRPDAADGRGNGGGTLFLNRFQQKIFIRHESIKI
ncbi:hypothetical protein C7S16_7208 [Burkholderia thailandensis]|uniref:Uncharacterized protein n=1 Tax=Burkholderia thailandensis TaxID=57975 RepID=A0AAW9CWC2_BURTH|nr:hypothetical protein [Burkholderia thailandensis]